MTPTPPPPGQNSLIASDLSLWLHRKRLNASDFVVVAITNCSAFRVGCKLQVGLLW
jgi:hypothetical protein